MSLIFRVLLGYLIACLVAGLAFVLFAWTPPDISTMNGDLANDKLALAMPVATMFALFSLPFAAIAFAFGERHRRRDWLYYALAGVAIALLGFFAQYQSEGLNAAWSITNSNYPLIAFITSGFLGGLTYWIFSGRLAGLRPGQPRMPQGRPGGPDMTARKPGTTGTTATTGNRPNPQRM